MNKVILYTIIFVLISSTALAANFTTDNVLQSNEVNDVFIYDTANESRLWKVGGNIGKCSMNFDGDQDYIDVGTNTALDFTTEDFTISFWANENMLYSGSNKRIFSRGRYQNQGYEVFFSNGRVGCRTYQNSVAQMSGGRLPDYSSNRWYYVSVVRDGPDCSIYVNGNNVTDYRETHINPVSSTEHAYIGRYYTSADAYNVNAKIDELMVFSRALSLDEMQETYERGLQGLKSNITSGLELYYDFDDCSGTSVIDRSENSLTGTITGATWKEKASWYKEGNAKEKGAYFDGDGDYVNTSSIDLNFGTGSYSATAWVYLDEDTTTWTSILNSHPGPSNGPIWIAIDNNGNIASYDEFNWHSSNFNPIVGKWYHVASVREGTGDNQFKLYVDGNLVYAGTSTSNIDNSNLLEIANSWNLAVDSFNGSIDNVRIFNDSLTDSEIKDLYSRELAGADTTTYDTDSNLVGYWDFENSSDWYADKSGEGNDGTAYGNTSVSMVDYLQDDGAAASVYDQAAYFDGVDDYIYIQDSSDWNLGTNDFTIDFWVKRDDYDITPSDVFSFKGAGGTDIRFSMSNTPTGAQWYGMVVLAGSGVLTSGSLEEYSKGAWHHFALTRSSGNLKLFVDGELKSTGTELGSIDLSGGTYRILGKYHSSAQNHLDGALDEVRVFKGRALSETEVSQTYERGLQNLKANTTSTGLVGYWSFDGDYDDDSGKNNDGTPNNGVYLYGRTGSKEFPGKSYLIATDEGLDIIDAIDDSLWMRFRYTSAQTSSSNLLWLWGGPYISSSVDALNSKIYLTNKYLNGGIDNGNLAIINFASEDTDYVYSSGTNYYNSIIADRNRGNGGTAPSPRYPKIISNTVNDVSVAEIDGNTYVAVATDGGVSVINESGNYVRHFANTSKVTGQKITTDNIVLLDNGDMYHATPHEDTGQNIIYTYYNAHTLGTETGWADNPASGTTGDAYGAWSTPALIGGHNSTISDIYVTRGTSTVDGSSNTLYISNSAGVTILQEDQTTKENGEVTHYTKGPQVSGQAAYFDGDGDYISSPDSSELSPTGEMSIGFWANFNDIVNDQAIIGKYDAAGGERSYQIQVKSAHCSANEIGWTVSSTGSSFNGGVLCSNSVLTTDDWHFVVVTFVPSTSMKIYIDGNDESDNFGFGSTASGIYDSSRDLAIGGAYSNSLDPIQNYFNGSLDEIQIFNRALSASEIEGLYDRGIAGLNSNVTSGRVAYYNFDDNSSDYQDKEGNNHGTKQGDIFLAYPIISGTSSNATSITADGNIMYVGTNDGISVINTNSNTLVDYKNTSEGLVGNKITGMSIGSVLYGTENDGAGTFEESSETNLGDAALYDETGTEFTGSSYTGKLIIKENNRNLAEFTTTGVFDISGVSVNKDYSRTVVSGLDTASGVTDYHSIFIPYYGGGVYVCPNANSLEHVNNTCTNVENFAHEECATPTTKTLGSGDVVTCSISDGLYKVSNLTGSGGGANEARVPEFSDYAIILAIALTLAGLVVVRKK